MKILMIALLLLTGCTSSLSATDVKDSIIDYETCVKAGNPTLRSYPGQCITKDGRRFVQKVTQSDTRIGESKDVQKTLCVNKCGDGSCDSIVCFGSGCPCAETQNSCAADCK